LDFGAKCFITNTQSQFEYKGAIGSHCYMDDLIEFTLYLDILPGDERMNS